MTIATRLLTLFKGKKAGADALGNVYYASGERRWVMYAKGNDASSVCPEWHAWLHHGADDPLPEAADRKKRCEHEQNATGTEGAYFPPAYQHYTLEKGAPPPEPAPYQAWRPGAAPASSGQ